MGKFFNDNLKHTNFPFKKPILGPAFAEDRRGNISVQQHPEQIGVISPIERDEGEPEQDNPDSGRAEADGTGGTGRTRKNSRRKVGAKRQRNRAAHRKR